MSSYPSHIVHVLIFMIGWVGCSAELETQYKRLDEKINQAKSPQDCWEIGTHYYYQTEFSNMMNRSRRIDSLNSYYFSGSVSPQRKSRDIRIEQLKDEIKNLVESSFVWLACHVELDRKGLYPLENISPYLEKFKKYSKNQSDH